MMEMFIVAVIVLWSALVAFKKVFPRTANRSFNALAARCAQQGWHKLAKWLRPAAAGGCGGSCGCDSNAEAPKKAEIGTVKWK
ncbi:DUF6587 family protein [Acinetobacter larvae]|uniref:Uncharacterized protein n=1 Tax=Acinetobacter larvae TaxID=1789224 RepID=A0A1B2M2Y5_9GAMM|nr:DUF6587 family protein [Acinetobacter larvae]AOA59560.1 hypothetical protein BFG52_15215 [Acinetobacter larvae]